MASSTSFALLLFLLRCAHRVVPATEHASAADAKGNEFGSKCVPRPSGKTLGERSTCPFTVIEDNNFRRVPPIIYHFNCHCPTTRCSELNDYRCVQVKKLLNVSFQGWNAKATTTKVVSVNASCVCATAKSVTSPYTDRILDETKRKKVPQQVKGVTAIRANESADPFGL
ncbi:hypothetical protein HPB50_028904 [Hyalomma asiaticum]|nr:hypothetical protein HPB50_028904 [Hyalomma asiaticum]